MKPVFLTDLKRGLPHPRDLRNRLALQLKARQESAARGYEIRVDCLTEHQAMFFFLCKYAASA
eukprot:1150464-Karenia_brevis.AAC.1